MELDSFYFHNTCRVLSPDNTMELINYSIMCRVAVFSLLLRSIGVVGHNTLREYLQKTNKHKVETK